MVAAAQRPVAFSETCGLSRLSNAPVVPAVAVLLIALHGGGAVHRVRAGPVAERCLSGCAGARPAMRGSGVAPGGQQHGSDRAAGAGLCSTAGGFPCRAEWRAPRLLPVLLPQRLRGGEEESDERRLGAGKSDHREEGTGRFLSKGGTEGYKRGQDRSALRAHAQVWACARGALRSWPVLCGRVRSVHSLLLQTQACLEHVVGPRVRLQVAGG